MVPHRLGALTLFVTGSSEQSPTPTPLEWPHGRSETVLATEMLYFTVDGWHAARTELAGRTELRLLACSRWPERQDCNQACAPQLPLVGDDRRLTPYAPFGLEPRFLRINNPVRMSPTLYARLAPKFATAAHPKTQ